MQRDIYLPRVELNMEGISVNRWFVDIGDYVAVEQTVLEVETQKAAIDVPASESLQQVIMSHEASRVPK